MKTWHKALLAVILAPGLVLAGYVSYLAATYIDETVTIGTSYGFNIGASKSQALNAIRHQITSYPGIAVHVSHGPRAGDNFTLGTSDITIDKLDSHDRWTILLDGQGNLFNTIDLTFRDGRMVEIHRHRKHFELP